MTAKKQKANRYLLKSYIPILLLAASLIFNIIILIMMPSHFSVAAIILLLTSLFAFFIVNNPVRLKRAYKGVVLCFVYSLIYLLVIVYWNNAGASACGEFYGSYRSCLGSAQQIFIEIFAVPVILLTATQPIFKKRI